MSRVRFLNVSLDNLTMAEALVSADTLIQKNQCAYVLTPNVDHIVLLETDKELAAAYASADLILTDGMPIVWCSKLMGHPVKEKISGSDFLPKLCEMAADKGYSMFFLGAAEGVAEIAAQKLQQKYQGLKIPACYSPPMNFENNPEEMTKIEEMIKKVKPDILVVALGCPKQEVLIYKNHSRWNVPLSIGVGASLDFVAGRVKRAPKWMSRCGLEWFYRLIKEPRRMFRRYILRDWRFVTLLWKYRKNNR